MNGKSMLIHGAVMALVLTVFGGARAADGDSVTLRRLITTYFDGVATKSFVRLESVVTRDFAIYEDGKVWNNDSVFHNIQYNKPFAVKFTFTGFRIFVDSRSGEARYHEHADFVIADSIRFGLDFISTATFRKTAAGWKISLIHVTGEKSREVNMNPFYRKYDTVRYIPEHYRERLEAFRGEAVHRGGMIGQGGLTRGVGIVMLGNSITEFGEWKRLLGDSGAVNQGIAGDNTFGMLERLNEVIRLRPNKLFIEAGINDIVQGVPAAMIAGNIASIVQYVRVKSPGTRVYVLSVLPTNDNALKVYPEIAGKNEVARAVDGRLREDAGSYGYEYIDLAGRVTDGAGNLDKRYAKPDGLHLNEAGYGVFVRMLREKGYL